MDTPKTHLPTTGTRSRRLLTVATCALTAAGVLVAAPATSAPTAASAASARAVVDLNDCVSSDNGLPRWEAPTFTPSAVDATSGPATVQVSVPITDTGGPGPANGVESLRVWVASLDDPRILPFSQQLDLVDGGDGVWSGEMTVPQHAPPGSYAIHDAQIHDGANWLDLSEDASPTDDLFTTTFEVDSEFDETAPEVTSLTLNRTRVNTRKRAKKVRITVHATDALSGVEVVEAEIAHQGQREYVDMERRGDRFTDTVRVRKFSGNARWRVRRITAVDRVGNRRHVVGDELRALGRTKFRVRSRVDRAEPRVGKATLRPTPVDIRRRGRTVRVRVRIRDNRAGVAAATAIIPDHAFELRRKRGSARNGIWTGKIRLSECLTMPRRSVLRIETSDRVGNTVDERIGRFRVRSRDHVAPEVEAWDEEGNTGAALKMPLEGPAVFRFDERVTGVDADSVSVRRYDHPDLGPEIAGTWRCLGNNHNERPCDSRHVRFAEWTPDEPVEAGDYGFWFNPEGNLGIRDRNGNPLRRFEVGVIFSD